MRKTPLLSVQLYDCTDTTARRTIHRTPKAQAKHPIEETSVFETPPPRITNQTIQTMRKTRMQMRRGTGAWPEILFISQPTRHKTQTRIHSKGLPGTGRGTSGQLSFVARNHRGDLPYQSRVTASQRSFIRSNLVLRNLVYCRIRRHKSGRRFGCQYARSIAHEKRRRAYFDGGDR